MHRISDTRVGGTAKRNLRIFQKLCGRDSFKNVVIVTTMWDKVTPEEGEQREQELQRSDSLFKPLMDEGATMVRHEGTRESALKIMQWLDGKSNTVVAKIIDEFVKEKKRAYWTRKQEWSFKVNFVMFCRNTKKSYKHWRMRSGKPSNRATRTQNKRQKQTGERS